MRTYNYKTGDRVCHLEYGFGVVVDLLPGFVYRVKLEKNGDTAVCSEGLLMNDYRGRKVCNIIESKFCWALHVDGERVFIYGGSVPYFKKHFEDLGYEINIVRKKGEDDADDSAKRNDKCRS